MIELVVWLLIAVLAAFWFLTGAWAFDIANQKGYPERTFLASLLGPFVLFELRNLADAAPCEPGTEHDWEKTGPLTKRCKNCGLDRQMKAFLGN